MEQASDTEGRPVEWEVTGNHFLAFPCISPQDGGLHRINVVHSGVLGLLEWASERDAEVAGREPLLGPLVRVDGEPAPVRDAESERLDHWIPRFRSRPHPDIAVQTTVLAPGGGLLSTPGAVYHIEVENRGEVEHTVEVGLAGTWRWALRTVASSRPLDGSNCASLDATGRALVLELGGEPGLAALAVHGEEEVVATASADHSSAGELERGEETDAPNGVPLRLELARTVRLAPGQRASVPFYLAVAVERDGAVAHADRLRRIGSDELLRLSRLQLALMTQRTAEPGLAPVLNRNLLFATFFGAGRAVDDDRLYPLVSRSPLAGEGAVFRERDALFRTLPALQLADPILAREFLVRAFEQYSHRAGAWTHYLDGGALSPAFSLGMFCAYAIALDGYVQATGDESILAEPLIREVIREHDELLMDQLHPQHLLAATEVLPSGDDPVHPYLTYDNVLFWAFCRALERVWPAGEGAGDEREPNFRGAAEEVAAALWRLAVVEYDGLRVLAGSTDLNGESAIYDDPEGSLSLLPYLGFCDADDPIWSNTMELLHSDEYPFWIGDRPFPGMASRTRPDLPNTAALCHDLLGPRREEALDVLRRMKLRGGVAGVTYDAETGETAVGAYHAGVAGLLAWTLAAALEG